MKAFISHSSIDKPFVERLATDLRTREGIDAWLDKWEILPGDRIPQKLEEGLSNAGILVLVLSPDSVNSQWVSYEKDAWLSAQVNEEVRARQESRTPSRRLIPVLYKNCEKPFFLQSFLHVSINDENYEEGFQQLVRGMRGESGKPPRAFAEQSVRAKAVIQRLEQEQEGLVRLERTLAEPAISIIGEQYIGYEIQAQVKRIVSEYTQQPFEGREDEKRRLDEFVRNNSSGVLLVTAAAGFGKSALLSHWQQTRQEDCFIAYHCFSYRYEKTRSVSEAYRHLLKQLYLYYNIRNGQFPNDENGMRDILVGMLREPVSSEGKRLVIVLDGLDEASKTFEPFFTLLPAGVFVIASARAEEGEKPEYLRNWTDNAQRLPLKRLPREAIPKWLEQISELATYSQDDEFIKSLDETTGGFPLYLRYLIDDLRQAATQSKDVREVLAETPKGFEGYVEQQLERLDELDLPEQKWQFFALLAVAKGVLEKEDIKTLTQMRDRDLRQLRQSWQVTRWMQITEDKFYAFAHPLLAKTFGDKLGDDAEDALQDLIDYCAKWQEYHSAYALRHYAEHLRDVKRWEELYAIAGDKNFASAQQQQLPDEPDLPLKTVQTALLGAAEEDKAERMAEFLLVHAYRLGQTNAQESPLEALRSGSLERALKLAEYFEIERCVLWYLLLAWELKDEGRWEEAKETLQKLQQKAFSHLQMGKVRDWQGDYAAYLLNCVHEVSQDICTALYPRVFEDDYCRHLLSNCLIDAGDFTTTEVVRPINSALEQRFKLETIAKEQAAMDKAEPSVAIAIQQAKAGKFDEAFNTIDKIQNQRSQQDALIGIALAYAQANDISSALKTATKLDSPLRQAETLGAIAKIQSQASQGKEVRDTLSIGINLSQNLNLSYLKAFALMQIAEEQVTAGHKQDGFTTAQSAYEVAQQIENEIQRVDVESAIAEVYGKAEKQQEAKAILEKTIEIGERVSREQQKLQLRSENFVAIAKAQARLGEFKQSLTTIARIEIPYWRADVLKALTKLQLSTEEKQMLKQAFDTVMNNVHNLSFWEPAQVLTTIAVAWIAVGETQVGLDIFAQLCEQAKEDKNFPKILSKVAAAQAEAGEITQALETVETIEDEFERVNALKSIAGFQWETGDKDGIATTLVTALKAKQRIQDERKQVDALRAIAQIQVLAGKGEESVEIVKQIASDKNNLLLRIVYLMAKVKARQSFKQLLIPCSSSLDTTYPICGYLALLYPNSATDIAKVVKEFP